MGGATGGGVRTVPLAFKSTVKLVQPVCQTQVVNVNLTFSTQCNTTQYNNLTFNTQHNTMMSLSTQYNTMI